MSDESARRKYTPEQKLKILHEIDSCKNERGSSGEILRREGLYTSQVSAWRKSLEQVIKHGIPEKKRGCKADPNVQLKKDKEIL